MVSCINLICLLLVSGRPRARITFGETIKQHDLAYYESVGFYSRGSQRLTENVLRQNAAVLGNLGRTL
jgi:hypothetical protein